MYNESEVAEKNIDLSAEFSRYLFEHPEIELSIPVGAEIILLPEFDPTLKECNLKMGKNIEAEGGKVVYIMIKSMKPKMFSRIENIEMQVAI